MSLKNLNPRFGILLLFMLVAGIIRVVLGADQSTLQPIAMFTPVGAMALFGGASFSDKWKSYAFPLLTLFLSDVILMQVFHREYAQGLLYKGWAANYISFVFIVLIGQLVIRKMSVGRIAVAGVSAALVHFLISNFGVWISGSTDITTGLPFTRDMAGLMKCYALAVPFMKYFLVGTLVYSAIFFGSYALVQRKLRLAH
ncbi:DUF6580 family putative transport protein [Chitinophaga qingshengii]|uniref:Lysoplasmalogenase n=1 Tax=Chitinophaga qingshengii TaxID=1569794 RepID=A0ABR7TXP5_9BACT|nr:DUF6580 family putative transport protein [Chitinophaga qingshengii]MBC9933834.1 hypothetical protein [Chitinophaga qingshengii]